MSKAKQVIGYILTDRTGRYAFSKVERGGRSALFVPCVKEINLAKAKVWRTEQEAKRIRDILTARKLSGSLVVRLSLANS